MPAPDARIMKTLRVAMSESGRLMKKFANGRLDVRYKGKADLVTIADRMIDAEVRRIVLKAFPDHALLTEEAAPTTASSGYRWIVDPIDGTTNFAHRVPHASVSIAVEHKGVLIAGGVLDPYKDELFLARKGRGSTLNGKRIRVSPVRVLKHALLATGFPYDSHVRGGDYVKPIAEFLKLTQGIRRFGSAALDLAYVACGRYDGYWESNLKPWDVAAGRLLVQEAGGKVTDFSGRVRPVDYTSETLSSNGSIHGAMRKVLSAPAAKAGM